MAKKIVAEKKPAFDILAHSYNPKFEIMPKEEMEKILSDLGVTKFQLPKILETDPVVKILGAKSDDVLKITRNSETAGKIVYYRVVVLHE